MVRVLVGGVFDILHLGHCYFLEKASEFGTELVVVVATDETAKRRGKTPIFNQEERRKMVEQVKYVDRAVLGYEEEDWLRIVEGQQPDIIALGPDQEFKGLEEKLKKLGLKTKVRRIQDKLAGYSTSKIVKRMSSL